MWLRLKPLASFCCTVALGSRSPASCSMPKRSNGMLRLKASITQSRHFHMSRCGIDVVAVGVGIAREIEPLHRHALAVLRQGQQAVHLLLVGVGGLVGEEGVDFGGGGRQAGEVEADAAQQGGAVGLGRGLESLAFQARQHQAVDRIARPLLIADGGHRGALRAARRPSGAPIWRPARSICGWWRSALR